MKFKIKKKEESKEELTLEEREKRVAKNEYTALIMLCISVTMIVLGFGFIYNVYRTCKPLTETTLYKGMKTKDLENDTLEDTQKLMNELENLYEASYINDIEREKIDEYVLNALVEAFGDKYAIYMDPDETIANYNQLGNHISGIGIYARAETEETSDEYGSYIIDVYDGSPADEAGLEPGDKITHVNGKRLSESKYTFSESIDDVKGEEGTTVKITFLDASDNRKEKVVRIKRRNTKTYTVRYKELTNEVGYIKITQFESDTGKDFKEAIDYFQNKGIKKYVFDLRDNSGGLKEAVVESLDYLLPEGLILEEIDNTGKTIEENYSDKECVDFESVILANEYTASAAEVFTKCLRDYDKTTIIGETTFGKGTICTTFNLSNGGSVMMSTGKYLTKSKDDVEKIGIVPDILMKLEKKEEKILYKLEAEEDDLIQKAIEVLSNTK